MHTSHTLARARGPFPIHIIPVRYLRIRSVATNEYCADAAPNVGSANDEAERNAATKFSVKSIKHFFFFFGMINGVVMSTYACRAIA